MIRSAALLPAMSVALIKSLEGVNCAYGIQCNRVIILVLATLEVESTMSDAPLTDRSLDRIDHKLLIRLQQDGRTPISKLARDVNLTVTPTLERVRRMDTGC